MTAPRRRCGFAVLRSPLAVAEWAMNVDCPTPEARQCIGLNSNLY